MLFPVLLATATAATVATVAVLVVSIFKFVSQILDKLSVSPSSIP